MAEEHEPSEEELERRVRHLLGEDGAPIGPDRAEPPDPIEARMAEIEERAKKIRANNPMPEPPEWTLKQPDKAKGVTAPGDYYRDLGFGLTVLYALVGPLGLGFGIGYLIDRGRPGSTIGQLWGTVLGALCGLIASFVAISKHERKG